MKRILATLLGVTVILVASAAGVETPERILSRRLQILTIEEYKALRDAWKSYTEKHPSDPLGWCQLARAARYAGEPCEQVLKYAQQAVKVDPKYADGHLLVGGASTKMYCGSQSEDPGAAIRAMETALSLDPTADEPHYNLSILKLLQGDRAGAEKHFAALIDDGHLPEPLVDFGYNLLVGLEPNAILLTNGDNDTYPLFALQVARSFRTDVAVLNLSLLNLLEYRRLSRKGPNAAPVPLLEGGKEGPASGLAVEGLVEALASAGWTRPLYLAVTVDRSRLDLPNQLTLEGLVYRVGREAGSEIKVDAEKISRNLGGAYRLESGMSLGVPWKTYSAIGRLMANYVHLYESVGSLLLERKAVAEGREMMERGLALCEFHGFRETGVGLAAEWARLDPGSARAAEWKGRFKP